MTEKKRRQPKKQPITTLRRRDIPGGGNPNVRYRYEERKGGIRYSITLPPEE